MTTLGFCLCKNLWIPVQLMKWLHHRMSLYTQNVLILFRCMSAPPQSAEKEELSNAAFVSSVFSTCRFGSCTPRLTAPCKEGTQSTGSNLSSSSGKHNTSSWKEGAKGAGAQRCSRLQLAQVTSHLSFSKHPFLCASTGWGFQTNQSVYVHNDGERSDTHNAGEITKNATVTSKWSSMGPLVLVLILSMC